MRITWVCCTEILPALALSLLQKILGVEKNLFRVCPSRGGAGNISVVAARAPKGATASFNPVQPGSGASVWAGTAEVKGKMRMWRKGWRNGSESRELTGCRNHPGAAPGTGGGAALGAVGPYPELKGLVLPFPGNAIPWRVAEVPQVGVRREEELPALPAVPA